MRAAEIPFAIAGAHAVAIHGHVRATTDIDVLIRSEDADKAEGVLLALSYRLESSSSGFAHYLRQPVPETPGLIERAELLLSSRELGHRGLVQAAAQPVSWGGVELPVVPVDILVLMKVMAGMDDPARAQDLGDARALLSMHHGALDLVRLRADADAIGADVRACLEALLAASTVGESQVRYGNAAARF